jgi:DNA polymerase-3 subunit epsilon
VVRTPRQDRAVGPFRSRADAAATADLLARFTGVRTCTKRLARSALHGPACPQHEVSPCPGARDMTAAQYAPAAGRAAALIDGLDNSALAAAAQRITDLAERQRYESAARLRDHTVAAVEVLWRGQRLRGLAMLPELVAAAPDGDGGWQLVVVRYGQLAAAGIARRGVPPMPVVDAIRAGAQVILPQPAPLGGALVEETALIARWLVAPGVRIVCVTGGDDAERSDEEERRNVTGGDDADDAAGWCTPLRSAGPWAEWAASARSARVAAEQAVTSHDSELLTEPHPSREQLFGRTAVDRVDNTAEPVLPRRQPLGAAG